eukprot:4389094-Heterocapsa_arctica.AAC.1
MSHRSQAMLSSESLLGDSSSESCPVNIFPSIVFRICPQHRSVNIISIITFRMLFSALSSSGYALTIY